MTYIFLDFLIKSIEFFEIIIINIYYTYLLEFLEFIN